MKHSTCNSTPSHFSALHLTIFCTNFFGFFRLLALAALVLAYFFVLLALAANKALQVYLLVRIVPLGMLVLAYFFVLLALAALVHRFFVWSCMGFGNYSFDINSVSSLDYSCDSSLCGLNDCCCNRYEIVASEDEMAVVDGIMLDAAKYAPHLIQDGELINVFEPADEEEDSGEGALFVIDKTEEGRCVFSYRKGEQLLCSLHSAALEKGLSPYRIKPLGCNLWPLALDHKNKKITIDKDVEKFPCCSIKTDQEKISPEVQEILNGIRA